MKKEKWIVAAAAGAAVGAVAYTLLSKDIPDGATPVQPFDVKRYLGKWNEIARLPNVIEKNFNQLTEDYFVNADGGLKVITRAWHTKKQEWKAYSGKLKFAGTEDVGMLKVSYFGPFYANYNVLDIDADYRYALVSGSGLGFLWILSKEESIPEDIKIRFVQTAKNIGFDIDKLEWMW